MPRIVAKPQHATAKVSEQHFTTLLRLYNNRMAVMHKNKQASKADFCSKLQIRKYDRHFLSISSASSSSFLNSYTSTANPPVCLSICLPVFLLHAGGIIMS